MPPPLAAIDQAVRLSCVRAMAAAARAARAGRRAVAAHGVGRVSPSWADPMQAGDSQRRSRRPLKALEL